MVRTFHLIVKVYQLFISPRAKAMFSTSRRRIYRIGSLVSALCLVAMTGCSSFKLPVFTPFSVSGGETTNYVGLEPGVQLQASASQEMYNKVRQAKAQNSVVLEVVGDETPIRILPLPPGQKSVFVSDLLTQTGVQKKLGALDAVLYRHSTDSIGGIRMAVKMAGDKRSVRAESDYALRAGDRLRVQEAPNPGLQKLVEMAIGL